MAYWYQHSAVDMDIKPPELPYQINSIHENPDPACPGNFMRENNRK
jgi:hypothetical protein